LSFGRPSRIGSTASDPSRTSPRGSRRAGETVFVLSPEISGGGGFTFEDVTVALYLGALLGEESAPGLEDRVVTRVAVQQAQFGEPLDDLIVDGTARDGSPARASLVADHMTSGALVCPLRRVAPTAFAYYLVGLPEADSLEKIVRFTRWLQTKAATIAAEIESPPSVPLAA